MMNSAPDTLSTRPYLIRALYEWCTDNGFTPYLSVAVNDRVQVPREYVKDGEIVLNISFDATSSLKLGNDFIEFKGRFAGTARDIFVPIGQILAIYARENGQGMAFPLSPFKEKEEPSVSFPSSNQSPKRDALQVVHEVKLASLIKIESESDGDEPEPPRSAPTSQRPVLKRVK